MSWSRRGAAHSPDNLHRVWKTLAAAAAASARTMHRMPAGMAVLRWRRACTPHPPPLAAGTRRLLRGGGVRGPQVTRVLGSVRMPGSSEPLDTLICNC